MKGLLKFITCGSVDDGKSTLIGHILYDSKLLYTDQEKALERVGLGDRVDFRPTQLSGGQKQRVAIARAMVNNPKILLADEPTGALDSKSGEQIMELFQKLNEEGVTIVMITHDPHIASNAKRMVKIIDGEIFEGDEKEDAS